MQNRILEYFNQITEIPHCSKDSDKLLEFLKDFAINRGYAVEVDSSKNILIKKGKPKLALQAHYDMVCIGKAPKIETYIDDGWLKAKNSSLGADNGIAIAIMMIFMDMGKDLEFLFTSDEEIGLIGASALEFKLDSKNMLNIDFEDEAEVCIGCAGGVDIFASKRLDEAKPLKYNYILSVEGLQGGHSGVDIDKNIPNAIKVLAEYLKDREIAISSFNGGERRNSIPTEAKATISSKDILNSSDLVKVKEIKIESTLYSAKEAIDILEEFESGVNDFNTDLNIPNSSINLAIVNLKDGILSIESSARAMSESSLKYLSSKYIKIFKKYNFNTKEEYKYPAWEAKKNSFTDRVYKSVKRVFGKSEYKAIHAGLECGVISEKYPKINFASIGPTIKYPHSIYEMVKIDSIDKTFKVILDLIEER